MATPFGWPVGLPARKSGRASELTPRDGLNKALNGRGLPPLTSSFESSSWGRTRCFALRDPASSSVTDVAIPSSPTTAGVPSTGSRAQTTKMGCRVVTTHKLGSPRPETSARLDAPTEGLISTVPLAPGTVRKCPFTLQAEEIVGSPAGWSAWFAASRRFPSSE